MNEFRFLLGSVSAVAGSAVGAWTCRFSWEPETFHHYYYYAFLQNLTIKYDRSFDMGIILNYQKIVEKLRLGCKKGLVLEWRLNVRLTLLIFLYAVS